MNFNLQHLLEFLRALELRAEARFRLFHAVGRNRHLATERFMVHQFLENQHLHRALEHFRLHGLGDAVMGFLIGENHSNLAGQIPVGQNCAIHSRHRLGRGQYRKIRRRHVRCARTAGWRG